MTENPRATARLWAEKLQRWLIDEACPLWSTHGFDRVHGGFHERLNGTVPLAEPRRVRVQPRQMSALSNAAGLGWTGDAAGLVSRGLDYLLTYYRRPDGLYRTLVAADGRAIDNRALLYDQAFVLLGLAESQRVLGSRRALVEEGGLLRAVLYRLLKHPVAGFESELTSGKSLSANAHMHLLEAGLAWRALTDDPAWKTLCDEIGDLALTRLIDAKSGVVREHFMPDWSAIPGQAGHLIEPGHHFEWAWLLFQWGGAHHEEATWVAIRLMDIGERYGVRDGFVMSSLLDDGTVLDASSRLWPQAERLRAAACAARITGEEPYWRMANGAAESLCLYLQGGVAGSWRDRRTPEGRFIEEPAPASTFYHIVGAIKELTAAVSSP